VSHDNDPVRLSADPKTSPWLRSALSSAGAQSADPALDVEYLAARVEGAILARLPAPDISSATKSSWGHLTASNLIFAGIGLVLGSAIGVALHARVGRHAVAPSATALVQPQSRTLPAIDSAPIISAASQSPSASNTAATPLPPPPAISASAVKTAHPPRLSEAELLVQARAALDKQPQRALELTQEHARLFPHGALNQESEVIAIEALSRLGQAEKARALARDFQKRYPDSAHQPKVEQVIQKP
jgi:hypothetical protein